MGQIISAPPMLTKKMTNIKLLSYFQNTWELSNILYSSIKKGGTLYKVPDPLRHPLIFYLGHSAAFYVNKLKKNGLIHKNINKEFEALFAQGVDPENPSCLNKDIAWPSEEEVWNYRKKVFDLVCEVILNNKEHTATEESSLWALLMAMEHDRIHFETSSVLVRQYPIEDLKKPENWIYAPFTSEKKIPFEMIYVDDGEAHLGKPKNYPTFGWDNEYGILVQKVPAFFSSNMLISNKQFYEFVEENGYTHQKYWTPEGWEWKEKNNIKHPKFWLGCKNSFSYRAMYDVFDLPLDWPIEVNFHEAQAYCNWRGDNSRLLSEAEFERIASLSTPKEDDVYLKPLYNLNLRYGSPRPVDFSSCSKEDKSFNDVYGNVWQWLSDIFYPLPGFKSHSLYADFSAPFFTPKHVMLKGGSWASTGTSASKYYRLWFRKNFYQHAGFRIAMDCY